MVRKKLISEKDDCGCNKQTRKLDPKKKKKIKKIFRKK